MYFSKEDILKAEHDLMHDFVDEESTDYNIGQISGVLLFVDKLFSEEGNN